MEKLITSDLDRTLLQNNYQTLDPKIFDIIRKKNIKIKNSNVLLYIIFILTKPLKYHKSLI